MNFQSFIEHLVREEDLTIEMSFDNNLNKFIYDLKTNTYYDLTIYETTNDKGTEAICCKVSRLRRNTYYYIVPLSRYESTIKELRKIVKEECMTPLETFCSEQWLKVLNKYA